MRKFISIFLSLIAILLVATSCEDSNSKSGSNSYLLDEKVTLSGHDNGTMGATYFSIDDKWAITPTGETLFMTQRPSCSGFNIGGGGRIDGRTCIMKYTSDDVDWLSKPYHIIPKEMWILNDNCLDEPVIYICCTNNCD